MMAESRRAVRAQESNRKDGRVLSLELLRGVAALGVMYAHAEPLIRTSELNFFWRALAGFGHEWVLIFFILSGVVNAMSVENRPTSGWQFFGRRIRRIYPTYLGACFVALAIENFLHLYHTSLWDLLCLAVICSGAAFSGLPPGLGRNPVIWTLTFEMIYYAIFALVMHRGKAPLRSWAIVSGLATVVFGLFPMKGRDHNVLMLVSYSGVWLYGLWLAESRRVLSVSFVFAAAATGIGLMLVLPTFEKGFLVEARHIWFAMWVGPLFLALLGALREVRWLSWVEAGVLVTGYAMAASLVFFAAFDGAKAGLLALPFGVVLMVLIVRWVYVQSTKVKEARQAILALGRYSFAIYLLHLPICELSLFVTNDRWWRGWFIILGTAAAVWLVEDVVRAAFLKIWDERIRPRLWMAEKSEALP